MGKYDRTENEATREDGRRFRGLPKAQQDALVVAWMSKNPHDPDRHKAWDYHATMTELSEAGGTVAELRKRQVYRTKNSATKEDYPMDDVGWRVSRGLCRLSNPDGTLWGTAGEPTVDLDGSPVEFDGVPVEADEE